MNYRQNNTKQLTAIYGAVGGNSPTLFTFDSVGHLRIAFLLNSLKIKRYDYN